MVHSTTEFTPNEIYNPDLPDDIKEQQSKHRQKCTLQGGGLC